MPGWLPHAVLSQYRRAPDYGALPVDSPDNQELYGSVLPPGQMPLGSDMRYLYWYTPGLVGHIQGPAAHAVPSLALHPSARSAVGQYCNSPGRTAERRPAGAPYDTLLRQAAGGCDSRSPAPDRPVPDGSTPDTPDTAHRSAVKPTPCGFPALP